MIFVLNEETEVLRNRGTPTARDVWNSILIGPQTIYRIHPRCSDRLIAHRQQSDYNRQQASDREHPPGNLGAVLESVEPRPHEVPRYRYGNKARDHDQHNEVPRQHTPQRGDARAHHLPDTDLLRATLGDIGSKPKQAEA
jgi:hypothetical protein